MSEASKNARRANIAKAKRLTSGSGPGKVDASSWTPPSPMKADKKTGMRPVSPRTYKIGGRVQGDRGPKRSDKAPRGNIANEISTRDTKQANRDKFGSPHIGGMKKGGAAHDDTKQDKALIKKMVKPSVLKRDAKCGGGRMANGGAADDDSPFAKSPPSALAANSPAWRSRRLKESGYSEDAVNKEIRKDKRIGSGEAKQIHRLLKGRKDGGKTAKKDGGSVAGGERPEGGRIPRARGGNASTYADKDDAPKLRLVKTHTDGNKTAKVYKDADWGEYRVKHYVDGQHQAKADYHTDDVSDANSTASSFLRSQRASGGRTKGKTNINIVVNPTKPDQNTVPPAGPVRPPAPPPMVPPPPPMAPPPGAPPPNMPPPSMMAGAGGPPPMRARGGRLGMNKIGGAGGGLGRLEKANLR